MRLAIKDELLPLGIITLGLAILIAFFPDSAWRTLIGIPFVLIVPGYALTCVLFPRNKDLATGERIGLALGMSLMVPTTIIILFTFAPWGITVASVTAAFGVLTLAALAVASYRRSLIPLDEQWRIVIPIPHSVYPGGEGWNTILSLILALSVVAAFSTLGWVMANPKIGERFTEFYILGSKGIAYDYPKLLTVGSETKLIAGIINKEQTEATYRVEVNIMGKKIGQSGAVTLKHGVKWEKPITFTPVEELEQQKLEFRLFKGDSLHRTVYLWVDILPEYLIGMGGIQNFQPKSMATAWP